MLSVALNVTALVMSHEVSSSFLFSLDCLSFTGEGGVYNHTHVPQVVIFIPVSIREGTGTRGDVIG